MGDRYNILFLTENQPGQSSGGTDRICLTLSNAFAASGCKCSIAYLKASRHADSNPEVSTFILPEGGEIQTLSDFLSCNRVDFVISKLGSLSAKRLILPALYRLTRASGSKMIVCYHAMPGEDIYGNGLRNSLWRMMHTGEIRCNFRNILLDIVPKRWLDVVSARRLSEKYRLLYDNCDALLLLSRHFFEPYSAIARVAVDDKFRFMGNALSYNEFATIAGILAKKRQVLVLSRMDERSKRISLALKAWKKICRRPVSEGWNLVVAGDGPDLEYYRRMSRRMHLERVSFEGRVLDVRSLYRESSIFVMTSAFEGWGITITEAQQFGAVPVAMNSFASLCETVTDGYNGLAVPDGDVNAAVDAVVALMSDESRRNSLALNAVESSRRFSSERICRQWIDLFETLRNI